MMFENYKSAVMNAIETIDQKDADALVVAINQLYSFEDGVEEKLQNFAKKISIPSDVDPDQFLCQLLGIFIGLELAKHGGLDANKT